jgi:hypothetical protein
MLCRKVRLLQDSLSAFFTPSNVRRSRVAQSSFSLEHLNDQKVRVSNLLTGDQWLQSPLEIVINNSAEPHRGKKLSRQRSTENHSIVSSKRNFHHLLLPLVSLSDSTPSPSSKPDKDKLFDSLSPYFSTSGERRRRHEKGEYLQLCNGVPPNKRGKLNQNKEQSAARPINKSLFSAQELDAEH